jgi:hypothetical protein
LPQQRGITQFQDDSFRKEHKELKEKSLQLFFFAAFALQYARVAHFCEDFTTDFTDFTDEDFAVRINSLSVPSVPSVVQFLLVAALPRCDLCGWPLSVCACQKPPLCQPPCPKPHAAGRKARQRRNPPQGAISPKFPVDFAPFFGSFTAPLMVTG